MGICKCSKRRVTQQFCFEHRVNVCEFCMVNAHPACIVQPYLQWLEDSSYKAKCSFCQLNLSNEECIRLLCYHVFHLTCLNKYCSSLPSNTTPAGYTCIDCNIPIFPSVNTPSPIYAALKKRLCTTEWARLGLGLPISASPAAASNGATAGNSLGVEQANNVGASDSSPLSKTVRRSEHRPPVENPANTIQQTFEQKKHLNSNVYIHHDPQAANYATDQSIPVSLNTNYLNNHGALPNDYLHSNHNNFSSFNSSSRKIVDSDDRDRLILDIDDDKYRHRSALDRLSRNFKLNVKFLNYKLNLSPNQRFIILICLVALVVLVIFYYLVKQARQNDDPLLDFKYNPNIHVQDDDNFN